VNAAGSVKSAGRTEVRHAKRIEPIHLRGRRAPGLRRSKRLRIEPATAGFLQTVAWETVQKIYGPDTTN
jgi:hypothetical protein